MKVCDGIMKNKIFIMILICSQSLLAAPAKQKQKEKDGEDCKTGFHLKLGDTAAQDKCVPNLPNCEKIKKDLNTNIEFNPPPLKLENCKLTKTFEKIKESFDDFVEDIYEECNEEEGYKLSKGHRFKPRTLEAILKSCANQAKLPIEKYKETIGVDETKAPLPEWSYPAYREGHPWFKK
jgi:hypothetical protein